MEELICLDCDYFCNQRCQPYLGRRILVKSIPGIAIKRSFKTKIVGYSPDKNGVGAVWIKIDTDLQKYLKYPDDCEPHHRWFTSTSARFILKNTPEDLLYLFHNDFEFIS